MHFLYIVYSKKIDKFYVGETQNLENRILQHNSHYFSKNFTKAADDWKIVLHFKLANREEALFLEKFIKRMKSRVFIKKIIDSPEILKNILSNR